MSNKNIIYQIINQNGLMSKGGENPRFSRGGKTWSNIGPFASHLSLVTKSNERESTTPASLFALYGDCIVNEIDIVTNDIRSIPFKDWFAEYVKTSYKFQEIARKNAKIAAKKSVKPAVTPTPPYGPQTLLNTIAMSPTPANVAINAPVKPSAPVQMITLASNRWSQQEKVTMQRALTNAQNFTPNLRFEGFGVHPTIGEDLAYVTISGVKYALLKL
jgi:hypothetical protein